MMGVVVVIVPMVIMVTMVIVVITGMVETMGMYKMVTYAHKAIYKPTNYQ